MYSKSRGTEGNRNVVKILKFIDDMISLRYTEYVGDCTPIDMRFPKTREHWPSLVQCFLLDSSQNQSQANRTNIDNILFRNFSI